MQPDMTVPLWTRALRNGSHKGWGNLLAMLKRAVPRHTASNDLLKKHISTLFPIFQTSFLICSPSFHPPDSFFFSRLTPFLLIVFALSFCSPKPLPHSHSAFLSLPPPSSTHTQMCTTILVRAFYWLILLTYPSLSVLLTITAARLPNPKINPVIILTFTSSQRVCTDLCPLTMWQKT